jgi:O-antigen ligase
LIGVPLIILALSLAFWLLAGSTAISRVAARFAEFDTERSDIWQAAVFVLKEYWPVGFGMGGFEPAIIPAEQLDYLTFQIPNRAHNEYLEIGIEAGTFGYLIILIAAGILTRMAFSAWRLHASMRRHVIFSVGVLLLVALHSAVDYPLRSMAISCLAGVAVGMLARASARPERFPAASRDLMKGRA